jgi:iron complex transport system substrate-binding protein
VTLIHPRSTRLFALGLVAVVLAGCSTAGANSGSPDATPDVEAVVPIVDVAEPTLPVTITDAEGQEVTVTDTSRIVPITAGVSEIVFSLGFGDSVVGRDLASTFDQAKDLPVITQAHDISAEGVLSLKPTLVIGDASAGPPEALEQLRQAGVPVVLVPEAWSIDEIEPRIEAVAEAMGVEDLGQRLVERTELEIDEAKSQLEGSPTVAFLYVRGQASVYLIGGEGAGADSLIEAIGGTDAGTKAGLELFTPLTAESMVKGQPDVILVMDKGLDSVGGVDGLLELPGIAQTPAGRDRRIISVEDGLLLSFGPRTGAVLQLLAQEVNGSGSR